MPVKSADTMISSHFDTIQFYETSNLDEFFDMKFLDIEPVESLFPNLDTYDNGNVDFNDLITAPSSPTSKYQIRHHDCMWSGTCVDQSHPSKKKGLNLCTAQSMQSDKTSAIESNAAVKVETQKNIMTQSNIMRTIMCKNNNNNNSNNNLSSNVNSNCNSNPKLSNGRSLLINNNNSNRINTNTAPLTQKSQTKCIDSNICIKHEIDTIINSSIVNLRPDTPLSLGDDVPDLKHNIDLTPCPSSNRMKFNDPNSIKIINALAEHLEETSNSFNDPIGPFMSNFRNNKSSPTDLNDILTDITLLSDYEDMNDDSSIIDMDDDDQMDENEYKSKLFAHNIMSQASTSSSSSSTASQRSAMHYEFISDHSYTRPKGSRYDPIALGVQTPSDSEEEVDVETIIEKNLPTNPSARDRRALQTTVAHKIARSKHAANQRRRVSDDDSISSSTSTLSSKGSTPIKYGSSTPQRYVSSHMISSGHSISRKRTAAGHSKDSNNNDNHKRYRTSYNKKQKLNNRKAIDQEELETIEKRNLHNNMERQRRIGLKNLFEQLKCHIPALKDKERAPKVNILREAAAYCTKLRRDEEHYAELMKKHNRLMTRVRNLKASIAAQQRRHY